MNGSSRIVDGHDSAAISTAVKILRGGGVVSMPTETVYGLAGATLNPVAIAEVYRLKGRPANNPLIAHVVDASMAATVVREGMWSDVAQRLAEAFWPGALTMVMARRETVDAMATGGRDSIAVRSPSHPVARALLEAFGGPLSAPSANRSGGVSPTTARHVAEDFRGEDLLVLDGGGCDIGLESTVLDLRSETPCILRPGSVSIDALRAVIGAVEMHGSIVQGDSPGTAGSHYAPDIPVWLVDDVSAAGEHDAVIRFGSSAPAGVMMDVDLGVDPESAGQGLYDALRRCGGSGARRILVQRPPAGSPWTAINDRLSRASAPR